MDIAVPRTKPIATNTWEVQARLGNTEQETDRVPLEFPMPSLVVGMYPSVIADSSEDLLIPTTNDILVGFDANEMRRYTNRIGQTSQANQKISFVTLEAVNTRWRDLFIELLNARPQMGFTFRWKRFLTGTPYYQSANISLALFVQLKDEAPGILAGTGANQ